MYKLKLGFSLVDAILYPYVLVVFFCLFATGYDYMFCSGNMLDAENTNIFDKESLNGRLIQKMLV